MKKVKSPAEDPLKIDLACIRRQRPRRKRNAVDVEDAGLCSSSDLGDQTALKVTFKHKLNGLNAEGKISTCKKRNTYPNTADNDKCKNVVVSDNVVEDGRSETNVTLPPYSGQSVMSVSNVQPALSVSEALNRLLSAVKDLFNQVSWFISFLFVHCSLQWVLLIIAPSWLYFIINCVVTGDP